MKTTRQRQTTGDRQRGRRRQYMILALAGIALLVIGAAAVLVSARQSRPGGTGLSAAVFTQGETPASAAADDAPSQPDRSALPHDFAIRTTSWSGGQTFVLSEQRGRPVVVYFMASWCLTCIPETQSLARLYEKYHDSGLQILIVDVDPGSSEAMLADFKKAAKGADHLWAIDKSQELVRLFDVRALDTTIIFDRAGNIVYRNARPLSFQTLDEQVRKYQ